MKIFDDLTSLTEFLAECPSYSLIANMPDHITTQVGQTCKLYALSQAMSIFRNKIANLPNARKQDNPNSKSESLRKQAKRLYGSQVGEMYNWTELLDLAKRNNMTHSQVHKPRNEDEYINTIVYLIESHKEPVLVFFDVSLDKENRGKVAKLKGKHEHAAAIFGLCRYENELYFIASQWGHYYLHKASDIAKSAMQLEKHHAEEFYKVGPPYYSTPYWTEKVASLETTNNKKIIMSAFLHAIDHRISKPATDEIPLGHTIISIAP